MRENTVKRLILFAFAFVCLAGFCGAETQRLFIGTYTGGENGSKGVYTCEFDAEAGTLSEPVLAAECESPSFLTVHPLKLQLFAVGETGKSGKLYSFTYRKANGQLTPVDEIEIPGSSACHLCLCQEPNALGDSVVIANYSSGNIVSYPVFESGKFGKLASNIPHNGSGPHARQKEPHPHGIFFESVDGKSVAVPDLGIDKVIFYNIDFTTAKLEKRSVRSVLECPPGTGPRHLTFSKDGRFAYVNGELSSTLCVFQLRGTKQGLIQTISTLPEGFDGSENATAEIELSSSGKFLYVSNRGHDSLAVFRIDEAGGTLSPVEIVPSGGKHPRFFALSPSGQFLLSCNMNSDNITVFRVDGGTGKLYPSGSSIRIAKPVCVKFVP
ncbi:MAG: lactonase family protein [Planctomycetaceae bacterium]|jgi:6-phosphogluconolactonase|nr:lactonase family protein [Planctomycetaceae bacterium]